MYFSIGNIHKRNEQQRNLSQTTGAVVLFHLISVHLYSCILVSHVRPISFFTIYGFCFMFVYKLTKKWKMTY